MDKVVRSEEYVTPDGAVVALDLNADGDLCAIEIAR
jgi:hypothetical protein